MGEKEKTGISFLYNHLLTELQFERDRSTRIDNKLNFVLVYIGTLLISTQFLFPDEAFCAEKKTAIIVLLIIMYLCVLSCLLFIFSGMFLKGVKLTIDSSIINDETIESYSSSSEDDAYKNHISEIKACIDSYEKSNNLKGSKTNISIVCAFLATILMAIILVIKVSWR